MRGWWLIALVSSAAFAVAAAWAAPQPMPALPGFDCDKALRRDNSDLPEETRRARLRLIGDPGEIAAVLREAARAGQPKRAEIELGVLRAAERLACLDPAGYRALAAYLAAHASDPAVADFGKAFDAQASAPAALASRSLSGAETYAVAPLRTLGEATVPAFVVSPNR